MIECKWRPHYIECRCDEADQIGNEGAACRVNDLLRPFTYLREGAFFSQPHVTT